MSALLLTNLEHERDTSQKSKYVNELKHWVSTISPDHLITLTFRNNSTGEKYAIDSLNHWLKMVNRSIYGRRSKKRMVVLPFIERNSNNGVHFHLMIRKPISERQVNVKDILKEKWLRLKGTGYATFNAKSENGTEEWFKPITDQNVLVDYLSKQTDNQKQDSLLVELINTKETP